MRVYSNHTEEIAVLFDLREPRAAEQLLHTYADWQHFAQIEALDKDHQVLIVTFLPMLVSGGAKSA